MARAYGDDLRRLLIEAHQQKEGSLPVLAKRLHVSVGWAKKVSATFRRSGSWARPPIGPARSFAVSFRSDIRRQVLEWIEEQPRLTLHELQSRGCWTSRAGVRASVGCGCLLRELGLRVKKSLYAADGTQDTAAVRNLRERWREQVSRIDPKTADFPGR